MSHHRRSDQPVTVLNQGVAKITQLRLLAVALLVQPCVWIGGGFIRLVGALLTVKEVGLAIRVQLRSTQPDPASQTPRSITGMLGEQCA